MLTHRILVDNELETKLGINQNQKVTVFTIFLFFVIDIIRVELLMTISFPFVWCLSLINRKSFE